MHLLRIWLVGLLIVSMAGLVRSDEKITILRNKRYKQAGDLSLTLDLYLPQS